jgi:hypothetical protein
VNKDRQGTPADLEGILHADWPANAGKARVLERALASRGLVAYTVVESREKKGRYNSCEKRATSRSRTRLRSAKLLDLGDRFLCECLIHDRSPNGLRLVLARNQPLPNSLQICDDETQEVASVAIAWRRGAQIGVRFLCKDSSAWLRPRVRAALRMRYYAIPD